MDDLFTEIAQFTELDDDNVRFVSADYNSLTQIIFKYMVSKLEIEALIKELEKDEIDAKTQGYFDVAQGISLALEKVKLLPHKSE